MTVNGPKRGDLEPDLVIDLVASPTTTDLTAVSSWRILGRLMNGTTLAIDAALSIGTGLVVNPAEKWKAVVTHQWTGSQTATPGLLLVEIEATWPGGNKQTFPTSGYIQIRISDDLG